MRIEQFEAIIATAKFQSMQKAAEDLYTTAQNISKLIKDFEKEFHVTIFVRNRHGVFLTEDGEYIVSELTSVVQQLRALKSHYAPVMSDDPFDEEVVDMFRVLSNPPQSDFSTSLLAYLNNRFTIQNVLFDIKDAVTINAILEKDCGATFNDYELVFTNVLESSFDFLKKTCPNAELFSLYKTGLSVHMHKSNPLAKNSSISVKDLYDQPLIAFLPDGQSSTLPLRALHSIGCTLHPKYIIKSERACFNMISKNMGYSIVSAAPGETNETVIIPLKEKAYINHVMLISPNILNTPLYPYIRNFATKHHKYIQQIF